LAICDRTGYEQAPQTGETAVSETDSFIEEVTEAVRRDRLFRYARKYGWIPLLAIFLLVGAAAYVEWQNSREAARAEALGDRVLEALKLESADSRATALADIDAGGTAGAIVKMMAAGELAATDPQGAGAILEGIAADGTLPAIYRDAAVLKLTMIRDVAMMSDERIARLEQLAAPGAPLRLLALEQIALLQVERGETDKALATARGIAEDAEATPDQRQRAEQLIIVLGGDREGA